MSKPLLGDIKVESSQIPNTTVVTQLLISMILITRLPLSAITLTQPTHLHLIGLSRIHGALVGVKKAILE